MAEIKIRKKRPVWVWVVLILIIVLALVYYLRASDRLSTEDDMPRIGTNEQLEGATGQHSIELNRSIRYI